MPIRLTTLGTARLTGPDPERASRVLAQPKRLALLAYLSARAPGERVARERVMLTFWPDLTLERAQANLRNAVYFLRKTLGSELVVSEGHTVGVSADYISCDAAEILDSVPADSEERLLGLYRGDFLDALHVGDAPDFERWVDRTRAELRDRVAGLAWTLCEQAEQRGEWITAAKFARKGAELAVDVEAATQRLIRLLDRAGDRAAAITAYERLATLLEADFGVSPSPETTALLDAVRAREASLGPSRASAAPAGASRAPGERPSAPDEPYRSLAVLPFEGLGGPGGESLATGLGGELHTALCALRGVRVLSRTSLRRFAAEPATSMQEVYDALAVDLVLEGSVRLHGSRARVSVHLVDARRDESVWAETYEVEAIDVFTVQSDVAIRVARALEVVLSPEEHRRLRTAPTSSPEAYRKYLAGRDAWSRRRASDAARAIILFEEALAFDPGLASAWSGLADAYMVSAQTGSIPLADAVRSARPAIRQALALDPASGEPHATLGLIQTFVDGALSSAGVELRRAVELSPSYATARQWYGQWLAAQDREDEALAELEIALQLDPDSPAINEALGAVLHTFGRVEAAELRLRSILERDPEYHPAMLDLSLCRWSAGDLDGAVDQMLNAWAAGSYGGTEAEATRARRLASRGAEAGLEYLRTRADTRARKVPITRVMEALLLLLLDRDDDLIDVLEVAEAEGVLNFTILYARAFDRLGGNRRFVDLMERAGLALPRWGRASP